MSKARDKIAIFGRSSRDFHAHLPAILHVLVPYLGGVLGMSNELPQNAHYAEICILQLLLYFSQGGWCVRIPDPPPLQNPPQSLRTHPSPI